MAEKSNKRTIKGVVVSDKMDKTIVVKAERLVKHSVFHKYVRRHVKYKAHDEQNQYKVGDIVKIQECAPMSKRKTWFVKEKIGESRR